MANGQLGTVLRYVRQLVGTQEIGDRTDGQLLEAFADRHEAGSLETLVLRHAPLVWGVCRRVLRDAHEAEDVFQATFLVLVKKAATLDQRGSLGNWLYTVAYHLALKARMKAARQPTSAAEAADMAQTERSDTDSEELRAVLDEELHRLPAKYRGPVVLCYLQGKTNEEAARELGYPPGSMSYYLGRGRERLRERLRRRGLSVAPALLAPILAESATAAIPPALLRATLQAGLVCAAGQSGVGAISAEALALAEGFLQATALAPLRITAAVLLAMALLGTGAGVLAYRAAESDKPAATSSPPAEARPDFGSAARHLAAAVERQVRDWQPQAEERRIDQIGWARDLRHAKALALAYNRPIFLYVHDRGMALGRCDGGAAHMRASALSNLEVIDLLNGCFVPVYLNTDEYRTGDTVPSEERAELQRTTREIYRAKVPFGSQWAVLLAPDGEPLAGLHGCTAARAGTMIAYLECLAREYAVSRGETVVTPRPQNPPPAAAGDALVLHLTARYLQRRGSELVPVATRPGGDDALSWRTFPAESWIVLDRPAWSHFLPPGEPHVGTHWTVDRDVSRQLFRHFYPQTENNDLEKNRIDRGELRATVVASRVDLLRVRIEGELRMKHRFTPARDDDRFVDATVLGFLDYEPRRERIRSLRLFTPRASYGPDPFGVAVHTLP